MSHQSSLIASDIDAYLKQHENKQLLRLLTCGSVDDGKSTLIGRLLHDSKMIYEDQLAAIEQANERVGNAGDALDLALLVDGLQAEREQGITIDVAYRYFSTEKRKFIIADTPGHEQYTRNMATGASNCELAVILVDARHGVQVQTKRHSFIVSQLGIRHVIVAINKMDLVGFDEQRYEEIKQQYSEFAEQLAIENISFVPLSALNGDNVVERSASTPWYQEPTLMQLLEQVAVDDQLREAELRFPVQYVNRPNLDFRGYCGTLTGGSVSVGDNVKVLPSGKSSKVKSIVTFDGDLQTAFAPMSVTLTLEDEIDISRGDTIVHQASSAQVANRFNAKLVWMSETPLTQGKRYDFRFLTSRAAGSVTRIDHQIDVNTLQQSETTQLGLNAIGQCEITLEQSVLIDAYQQQRGTGAFIVVDRLSNATVAAGMIETPLQQRSQAQQTIHNQRAVSGEQKAARFGQRNARIAISGGQQTERHSLLYTLEQRLFELGRQAAIVLDVRGTEQVREHAELLQNNGLLTLCEGGVELEADIQLKLADKALIGAQIDQLIEQLQDENLI